MFVNIAVCLVYVVFHLFNFWLTSLKKVNKCVSVSNIYNLQAFAIPTNSMPDMPAPDMADKKLQNFL